ncbi:MAG: metallophosphoesterase [Propionibacteriaceae bacterium]|nr:metallophosphoesterase [Propionibacteriaceae bacterium]
MEWLVQNKDALDLRYVLHSGDVTNWGWIESSQYTVASDAFSVLDAAGIPYEAAIGNHDTRAVGYNGDAANPGLGRAAYQDHPDCPKVLGADQSDSRLLVRHTEEWNGTFPASRFKNVAGTFETGKSDNMYQTFSAGGVDWLVLTLELYPRAEAVDWAKQVVSSNPNRKVIVVTHSYLTGDLQIGQNAEYGSTTPQYLFDNLIKVYPNIKMVFSGHTGEWGTRVDKGNQGNTIVSYLTALHSTDNPLRTLEVNTGTGQVTTKLVTPNKGTSEPDNTPVTLSFVKPQ